MRIRRKHWSRRKFLLGTLGAATCGIVDIKWLEPHWLGTGRHDVKLGTGDSPALRLVQLSDLHASESVSLDFIRGAVQRCLELKPDIICLTGDFITSRYDAFGRYAEVLKPLSDRAPTFATLGNHDGARWAGRRGGYSNTELVRKLLSESRIELLHNRSIRTRLKGRTLDLVGIGDLWAQEVDAAAAFSKAGDGASTILLAHNPDSKELVSTFRWDLMLCGHTHGGECDLAFFGTPFAPVKDKRYVRGLHPWKDRWIHTTKGVGSLYGVRFNCRPEVSVLTLF